MMLVYWAFLLSILGFNGWVFTAYGMSVYMESSAFRASAIILITTAPFLGVFGKRFLYFLLISLSSVGVFLAVLVGIDLYLLDFLNAAGNRHE